MSEMNNIKDIEDLVKLANEQKDLRSRLKGSLDIITKDLKSAGFVSISDAKKKLESMGKEKDSLEKSLDSKIEKFRKDYEEYL